MTIGEAIYANRLGLNKVSDDPILDIERILMDVLGQKESAWLYAHGNTRLTDEQQEQFERLMTERATGKPLAYILGEWEFYGRPFYVTSDVLVPRPETEEIVRQALKWIGKQEKKRFTIVDMGTGSGCIAITLAVELMNFQFSNSPASSGIPLRRGNFQIIATDISEKALKVARRNAERYGVADEIEFLQGDMMEPFNSAQGEAAIDLVVSNPPYLPAEALAKAGCSPDTMGIDFEPKIALDGGLDGLKYVKQLLALPYPVIVESVGGKILTNFEE